MKRRKVNWNRHVTRSSRLANREQYKEGDREADRGNDGKTTSERGLALGGTAYCGKLRTARNEESWM